MAVIPKYFSQVQAGTSGLPRAPAGLADTGQGLEAQSLIALGGALGQIGQGLADIEIEKQRARDNVTLAEMKGALDDFEFDSRPDPTQFTKIEDFRKAEEKYGKDWQRESQRISKGSSVRVADQFKIYTELHWDAARKDYHNKSWPLEQNYALAQFNRLWSEKLQKFVSKPVKLKGELQALIEQFDTYLKPTEKQKLEASIDEEIAKSQKQALLDTTHEAAKVMLFNEAISFLNDLKGVTRAERNDLIARRERQNEIETATRDSETYWNLLRRVTKDPDSVSEPEIADAVKPNGITTDDYKELVRIKDTVDDPLKAPRAQLYFNSLDKLFDKRETDAEERLNYDIANEKLMQFFKDNPKVSAKQAAEFYDELINPEVEGILEKAFNFWLQSPFGILGRRALGVEKEGEEKSPFPEYPDAFLEDGVWKVTKDGKKYRIE